MHHYNIFIRTPHRHSSLSHVSFVPDHARVSWLALQQQQEVFKRHVSIRYSNNCNNCSDFSSSGRHVNVSNTCRTTVKSTVMYQVAENGNNKVKLYLNAVLEYWVTRWGQEVMSHTFCPFGPRRPGSPLFPAGPGPPCSRKYTYCIFTVTWYTNSTNSTTVYGSDVDPSHWL